MSSNGTMNGQEDSLPVLTDLNVSAPETAKGGLKYELVLSSPVTETPARVNSPTTGSAKPIVSVEMIQQKLVAAAERRQSLECEKLASLAEKFKKIEEAAKKREEEENNFINVTKESLEQKMEIHVENRESIITDLKTKLNNHHTNHLQEVRQNLEMSVAELEEKAKEELSKKLEVAERNREKVIQERLDTLKKHEEKVELVRTLKRNSSLCEDGSGDGTEVPNSSE